MLMACPVADDTIVRAMKIFMEKFIVKDNLRRERDVLIDARVAFIVFMERSVKKCRKHFVSSGSPQTLMKS